MRVREVKSITRKRTLWSGFLGRTKPGALKTTSKYDVSATPPARVCSLWQPLELQVKLNTGSKCRSKLTLEEGIVISAGSVTTRPHECAPNKEAQITTNSNEDSMGAILSVRVFINSFFLTRRLTVLCRFEKFPFLQKQTTVEMILTDIID